MPASTPVLPPDPEHELSSERETAPEPNLAGLQAEMRRQGDSIRSAEQRFSIFAVIALLISFGMLVVVAAKLDGPTKTVTAAAPASAASSPAAALPSTATERLTEMKIAGPAAVAAGPVTFNVSNAGAVTHELVVLRTNTPAGSLPTDAAGRASEAGNIGETGDLKAGASKTLRLKLAAGHYALICNLPGHYKAGMYANLTVK